MASLALLGIVCMSGPIAAQKSPRSDSSPTFFEPDYNNQGLENAHPPTDRVLAALLRKIEADGLGEEIENLAREQKRALFEVVRVNLGPKTEIDYVVHGKPPMIGADSEWFWIVRVRQGKADVILFSNGLALELKRQVSKGYRDISVSYATAAYVGDRLYRYDGSAYKLLREQTKEQKP